MGTQKELFYETIAEKFEDIANPYDVQRRKDVIFDDFLGSIDLCGKMLLDAGCGFGALTDRAVERGAKVTAIDISRKLVEITQKKCPQVRALAASILALPFEDNMFDVVISSDVIEHTEDPWKALDELIRVLKPGGILCVTVPNRTVWYFAVVLADKFGWRKYAGNENWLHFFEMKRYLCSKNLEMISYKGIHLFPFVVPILNGFLRFCDRLLDKTLGFAMVNIAAMAKKR
jgi:2-polyprenyl-6-hydroxyphenyl methylase/3-demethylubiquinone-9 3-methyltransferase